jgi:hypothetical protein
VLQSSQAISCASVKLKTIISVISSVSIIGVTISPSFLVQPWQNWLPGKSVAHLFTMKASNLNAVTLLKQGSSVGQSQKNN